MNMYLLDIPKKYQDDIKKPLFYSKMKVVRIFFYLDH